MSIKMLFFLNTCAFIKGHRKVIKFVSYQVFQMSSDSFPFISAAYLHLSIVKTNMATNGTVVKLCEDFLSFF